MSLAENAVMAIGCGLEDLDVGTEARLRSAVRSLHAGMLLLFKEKLRRLSPKGSDEVLLKSKTTARLSASGGIDFVGSGRKTVDIQQIRELFKALDVEVDWTRVDKVTDVRNAIEHYYPNVAAAAVRGLVSDLFLVLRDFVKEALGEEPAKLLGKANWARLLKESRVFEKERERCIEALEDVDWENEVLQSALEDVPCDQCGSILMMPVNEPKHFSETVFKCAACATEHSFEKTGERALQLAFYNERYIAVTDGDADPLARCSSCGKEGFVVEEGVCVLCTAELDYTHCVVCQEELGPDDQLNDGFCSNHANAFDMDD